MNRTVLFCLTGMLLLAPHLYSGDDKDAFLVKATRQVLNRLTELKAPEGLVKPSSDKVVADLFPGHVVVVVGFRQWPVEVGTPDPLKSRNLFVVSRKGDLEHFTDSKGLEKFFKAHVPASAKAENVVRAWLLLSQEFVQDGFFKFKIADKVEVLAGSSLTIASGTAEVVPEQGNKGFLKATLRFDRENKLASVTEENKVLAGVRPRCQAKLLVHADPVIRAIAEQDLLVLGRAAEEYLQEQRALADEELRRAIDRVWRRIVDEGR